MANETLTALGPLFGPNFITVQLNDETNRPFQLQIYPDANNPLLKANGLPTHYYFMPQRVYLAKKQTAPADFDFGATIFKGLMTTEDTVGITDAMTSSGAVSAGGGICVFATTFAVPESVIEGAKEKLRQKDYPAPPNIGRFAQYFDIGRHDPKPELGMVPILENDVTIEVPKLSGTGTAEAPFFIDAQGTGKGSIEATSISAFLVTLNMLAAGAVIGSLEKGMSPFTVHYNLKQLFYINACDIHIIIDVDKVYQQFSAAVSAGSLITNASLSANYQNCLTSGAIKTIIRMAGDAVSDDLKKMIEQQVEDMQTRAFELVKKEIFDWEPTPMEEAKADKGLLGNLFGGAGVSVKASYQKRAIHLEQDFQIDTTVTKLDTVAGTLNDLEPAIKANLDKYLAIVDIGDHFKKIQVAATNNVNWAEKLQDGTDLSDPIRSVQVQVAYPDYETPVGPNRQLNLRTQAQGYHYVVGSKDPRRASELAVWTKDNPRDIINLAFLRLDKAVPGWDADQVRLRKTLVFDSSDPRVDLSNNGSTFTRETTTHDHAPVITPDEVGYVFVRFVLDRKLPDNVTVTLTCRIGARTDTITMTKVNCQNAIWQIFSDKYVDATFFEYDVRVEATGANFTDDPVEFGTTAPVRCELSPGRIKYVSRQTVKLPAMTAEQSATLNAYIKACAAAPSV